MAVELFSKEWADEVAAAINAYPDDAYRETKLFLYWDWIKAAREGFDGTFVIGAKDVPDAGSRYAAFTMKAGQVVSTAVSDSPPDDATYVLAGKFEVWKDIVEGYDSGKAVMYRRLRLEQGDVFRFFNRIYFFTESLVAASKVPATLPA